MDRRAYWLASLSTRDVVLFMMELRNLLEQEPALAADIHDACSALRAELQRREWSVPASR